MVFDKHARRNTDPEKMQEQQHDQAKHQQMQSQGQEMQRRQVMDLMQNPAVIDTLVEPDLDDADPALSQIPREHLHIDQVLAIYDSDDLWRKGWKNKIWAGRIQMSFPFEESRTDDRRINEIQKRIHGHDKRPLTADERRNVQARLEQKTDREKRSKDGEFVELLLSQVVKSEEKNSDTNQGSGGLLSFGGDD